MIIRHKYPLFICTILIGLYLVTRFFGVTINDTSSMPRGLYIKQQIKQINRGDVVSFCLPEPYKTIGLKSFYIEKGSACDGAVALVKKVIAIPNDVVILNDDFIKVNNTAYQYKTKYRDSYNNVLTIYPRGKYKSNGYWLIGTNSENSWDSRYWGEIKEEQIIEKLKPLVTWN